MTIDQEPISESVLKRWEATVKGSVPDSREGIVERLIAALREARAKLLECLKMLQESKAIMAQQDALLRGVEKAEAKLAKVSACLQHVLDMGHLTPGGSTEKWAKEVLGDDD